MASSSGYIQVWGGNFSNAAGQPYAGGSLYATPSAETVAAGQLSSQEMFLGTLDAQGNLPLSANVKLWASDTVIPQGTVYAFRVTDANGSPVFGPTNFYLTGISPVNLNSFQPTTMAVSYPAPIVQNPVGDQTIETNSLLPAPGNTTQSLGSSEAPWNGVFNNAVINGTASFNIVNALTGFQVNGAAPSGDVLRGNGTDFVPAVLAASDLSNGATGTGAVVLANGPSFSGKFVKYNGLVVGGNGVPSILYQSLSTGLTSNFNGGSAVTLYTPITPAQFRITWSEACTHAATSSSSLPNLTFGWTDAAGVSRTLNVVVNSSPFVFGGNITLNTTALISTGCITIYTNGSTPVTATSANYSSSGSVSMSYDLSLSLEAL